MRKLKKGLYAVFLLILAPCLLVARPAQAEQDYFDLPLEKLLTARVYSASKKSEPLSTSPAAVYVITQEDILRSGMTKIPDLLRMVPGVNVGKTDSNTWAISIRGFQNTLANKLLVMIDGRTVYNPFFGGTFWEIEDLPLHDIARIEVIRGPGGSLWGANAVNGVINIITKSAGETQGTYVSAGAGNYENAFSIARVGRKISDDGFARLYGKFFNRGSTEALDANGHAHDSWDSYQTGFRADWGDPHAGESFTLHGDLYRTNTQNKTPSYSFIAPFQTETQETIESTGGNFMGVWRRHYDDGSMLRLQSYLDGTAREQILFHDRRLIFDTDAQYNLTPTHFHEIALGGSYRLTMDNIGGSNLVNFDPSSRTDNLFTVFGQDKITLRPDLWFLTLGSKIEHNVYTGFEIEPNVRLSCTPSDQKTLWASASRAVRTPTRFERDLDITNLIGIVNGNLSDVSFIKNRDFQSEELNAYELGFRDQITRNLTLDMTAFLNDYSQLSSQNILPITVVNNGVDPLHLHIPVQAVNGATAEVYGFETAASWQASPNWNLSSGYTYLKIYLHAPAILGQSQDSAEGTSPQQQFNLRSYWNINKKWSLDTMLYYVGEISSYNIDPHLRLDLNLGWKLNKNLRFNLVGQNLLEKSYREYGSTNDLNTTQAGIRSIFGRLSWEF